MTEKIVIPDVAIRQWNERYYPKANERKPDNTNCIHCGDLVSEYGFPFPIACNICIDKEQHEPNTMVV